ncbi:MAG: hypothetical protein WBW53_08955 [Terriglobales bacterium]
MRSFPILQQLMIENGNAKSAVWVANAIEQERARIRTAISFLEPITRALEQCGKVIVIKSLDHWPDFGSDIDIYIRDPYIHDPYIHDRRINAQAADVVAIMRRDFRGEVAKRSWGDRLANKWNFIVPGLPELVEIHIGRLGQTGEQTTITESLLERDRTTRLGGYAFRVPAPEDRIIVSTLQRMYRHFYIRLCDIVDNALLVQSGTIDYVYLRTLAQSAGLWEGVATYLAIVSDIASQYASQSRGEGIALPSWLKAAARFGVSQLRFQRNWLRIPIVPHGAHLYAEEWKSLFWNGEIRNALRLSLLPGLATAAALQYNFTGSDKGLW